MKLLLFFILVFFSHSGKEFTLKRNDLEIKNYIFLDSIFSQNISQTQKYWHEIANGLEKLVFISIENQLLNVLVFSDTFYVSLETKVSTGKHKDSTPRGEFEILKKRISRPSKKYGGVMTLWNCLTPDEALGIHSLKDKSYERSLGKPASHGCIRVGTSASKVLYTLVPIGTEVLIE